MSEVRVLTDTVCVGKQTVQIVGHLWSRYTIYLDVNGSGRKVEALDPTTDSLIVSRATARGIDPDWGIVVIADDLGDRESLSIYGVETAPT